MLASIGKEVGYFDVDCSRKDLARRPGFYRLVHADWSVSANKRWFAEAKRLKGRWYVEAPKPAGPVDRFLSDLLCTPQPTLAGFDFPIGLPISFGGKTGFSNFGEALDHFGVGEWSQFYAVAEAQGEISIRRPFYPRVATSSARQHHLFQALEEPSMTALLRECERATPGRAPACSLFWTLGGNQVGKAAISGWKDVVCPARTAGAFLWPFDGTLETLGTLAGLAICETYPAEAYHHIDLQMPKGGSKQRQNDRRTATAGLIARCEKFDIQLSDEMSRLINDGFGSSKSGEDPFDAAMGLFGMIEVVEGRRIEAPAFKPSQSWEGWILGRGTG